MTPSEIGYIGIGVMVLLLFLGVPVGFTMTIVGFTGFALITGFDAALGLLRTVPYSSVY